MFNLIDSAFMYTPMPFIISGTCTTDTLQNQNQALPSNHQSPTQAQFKVFALQELRLFISDKLELHHIATCCLVSRQWYQDWSPICWKHIHRKEPKHFVRHGHLIRTLDIKASSKFSPYREISNYCLNLLSLKILDYRLKPSVFEEEILGIEPGVTLPSLGHHNGQKTPTSAPTPTLTPTLKLTKLNPFIDDGDKNGFLSNSLESLELHVPPVVCEIILPWVIQAKKHKRLLNLQHFTMGTAVISYLCLDIPISKTRYSYFSDVITILNEFPNMRTFSTSNMDIIEDICIDEIADQVQYRIHSLGIKPTSIPMLDTLISRMPNLTSLSIFFVGTVNLFPSIRKYCPNLTSLVIDMEGQTYPHESINDNNPDEHLKYKDWIDLFTTLTKLERFEGRSVTLPRIVLKALADSCPKLKYFKTCSDSTISILGFRYLLLNCKSLTDLIINQICILSFHGDDPWKAPIENLVLDSVSFRTPEEDDNFRGRMQQLPFLKSLSIAYAGNMSIRALVDSGDVSNSEPSALTPNANNQPFLNLESLHLGYFSDQTPESIKKIISCMPRLRSLSLKDVYNQEDILKARSEDNICIY